MTTYRLHLHPKGRAHGPWIGWGASLLAHAGILAWLLLALPKPPPAPPDVPRMRFVLVPPRPAPPAASVPSPAPAAARPAHAARSAPAARASVSRPAPVVAPETAPAAATPVTTAETPASDAAQAVGSAPTTAPAADVPAFDMAAARKTARLIEKHRKDGLVALPKPDPPLQRDDRLERAIERARRPDCKTAYSGLSLLAVIPLVKDTVTGTGCKW